MYVKSVVCAAFILSANPGFAATLPVTIASPGLGAFGAIDMACALGDLRNGYVLNGQTGEIRILDTVTGQTGAFLNGLFPSSDKS